MTMFRWARNIWESWIDLFSDDDASAPSYDPAHLGAVAVVCLAVIGALYWLLWTLLVYEGGLFLKLRLIAAAGLGQRLPEDGLAGWLGNVIALCLSAVIVIALRRVYRAAQQAAARRAP
jgi:hypothetical protein